MTLAITQQPLGRIIPQVIHNCMQAGSQSASHLQIPLLNHTHAHIYIQSELLTLSSLVLAYNSPVLEQIKYNLLALSWQAKLNGAASPFSPPKKKEKGLCLASGIYISFSHFQLFIIFGTLFVMLFFFFSIFLQLSILLLGYFFYTF